MLRPAVIAIVDDDESVCRALARLIRASGLEARAFSSAAAFLETLAVEEPDCAVLDVQMPGVTGLALQEHLRRQGRQLPVIFLTAHDGEELRQQALAWGAQAFLSKPLGEDVLVAAIRKALAHRVPAAGVWPRPAAAQTSAV
jgi:FixJ family two-component response regulator